MNSRVLVIDDDASMLHIVRAVLEGEGLDVVTTDTGRDALRRVASEDYSLVITDILMPGRVGTRSLFEFLEERADAPPVIVVSAYWDTEPELRDYFSARAAACLTKPFDINDFRKTVRRVLGGNE